MKRAIIAFLFALWVGLPGYAAAQSPIADPAQIIINDEKNFGVRIGSEEFANMWAYERLDPAYVKRWRNRRVGSGAIIATGGVLAYAAFQSATLWFLYWAALGFTGGDTSDPVFLGWGVLSVAGMLGGGGLVYYGATRSKHPYTPAERVNLVHQFNSRTR